MGQNFTVFIHFLSAYILGINLYLIFVHTEFEFLISSGSSLKYVSNG
jgi:hypothetical protein